MANAPGEKLHVNLSASQVRKLLKGHGLGVRRVESAGRNQSFVIHTATGQHRRELESLLAKVSLGTGTQESTIPVSKLRNLGPVSSQWLQAVGIKTKGDLQKYGPLVAYQLVKRKYSKASLNLLWALVGALKDQDWRDVPARERKRLLAELE